MIIGNRIIEESNRDIFKIDVAKLDCTWNGYLEQYAKVLNLLIEVGTMEGNCLKQQFMPFLFVFRHVIELTIKNELKKRGISFNEIHNVRELSLPLEKELPSDFYYVFSKLRIDDDGSCFRYIETIDGKHHFNRNDVIEALPILDYYSKWYNNKGIIYVVPVYNVDANNKKQRCNFLFRIVECEHLGVMRTQYDTAITTILKSIVENKCTVEEVFMPLMFMLRHSVELGLKDNLKVANLNKGREHKLRTLFNTLNKKVITNCICRMPNSCITLKQKTEQYRERIEKLSDSISILDNHAKMFRFPCGGTYSFSTDTLIKVYDLYSLSDTFLTFGTDVLAEYGFLDEITNVIIDELDLP